MRGNQARPTKPTLHVERWRERPSWNVGSVEILILSCELTSYRYGSLQTLSPPCRLMLVSACWNLEIETLGGNVKPDGHLYRPLNNIKYALNIQESCHRWIIDSLSSVLESLFLGKYSFGRENSKFSENDWSLTNPWIGKQTQFSTLDVPLILRSSRERM